MHAFDLAAHCVRYGRRLCVLGVAALALAGHGACFAQSTASVALSALPLASIAVVASGLAHASGDPSEAPAVSLMLTELLVVVAADRLSNGTRYVLERASDGARFSVQFSAQAAGASLLAIGTIVETSAMSTGVLLTAAGEVIAFIPNAVGKALLHAEPL